MIGKKTLRWSTSTSGRSPSAWLRGLRSRRLDAHRSLPPSARDRSRRAAPRAARASAAPKASSGPGAPGSCPTRLERRHLHALRELVRAARPEVAALGPVAERGRQARDRRQPLGARPVDARDRAEQAPGVGMLGVVEDLVERPLLDDPARVHDGDAVGDVRHHAQVVGHEDYRRTRLVAQLADALQDLRLDRHVERRGGLVGDQDRRVARQRKGDHHALAHAARELVRVGVEPVAGAWDPDLVEQLDGTLARLLVGQRLVLLDLLGDLRPDLENRVQRGHRVLEDHRDLCAAHAPQLVLTRPDQLGALVVGGAFELASWATASAPSASSP